MFRLRTLGGAALEQDGVRLDSVGAQRKSLALLALLAVARDKTISRDRVVAYIWPESDTERARGALKQTLHVVRRQLGSGEAIIGTAELRLNPSYIESDVDAFLGAVEEGRLELAADLYGGPFLDGFHLPRSAEFEQWASAQREALAQRYASVIERLAADAEARGDPRAALPWLRRLQAADPLSTHATLRLMRALGAAGERAAALRYAQVHESLLRDELDSPPDTEVAALAEALREERPVHPDRPRPTPPSPTAVPPASEAPGPAIRRSHVAAFLATVFSLVAAVLILTGQREQGVGATPAPSEDRSVAVLPFSSMSGDSASEHLSNGITSALTTELSSVHGLEVPSVSHTYALTRKGIGVPAIADTLGVATVLHGAVWRDGDRLKITARLVRVRDDRVLWSETYDREMGDIFAIQAEISRATMGALDVRPSPADGTRPVARPTRDVEAYELYLRARYSWMLPSRERLEQAALYYQGAIERDPAFAMAYAGLSETYANLSNFGHLDQREAFARAGVAADRALALDPGLAEAHTAKGFVLASTQEFDAAEQSFQRAIQLNPTYVWARHYYSLLLMMVGRTDEALEQNRHALAAEAYSLPANATRGIILLQRGDYRSGERELQRTLALSPGYPLTRYYLATVLAAQGRYEEAGPLLDQSGPPGARGFTGVPGARALVLQRTGRQPAADSLLRDLEAQASAGDPRSRANLAFAHAALGRMDAAFALFDQMPWDVPSLIELRADPLLEPMRADPRYPALLRRIGAGQ